MGNVLYLGTPSGGDPRDPLASLAWLDTRRTPK